jgi:hypothetical protein
MTSVYPIYSLGYRRPEFIPSSPRSRSNSQDGSIRSDVSNAHTLKSMPSNPRGVPEALSFDRIINGGCCPVSLPNKAMSATNIIKPLTKREFLNYLKYQEKSAENLQFYLWYQDYVSRFAQLPESERSLAPEWTEAHAEAERKEYRQAMRKRGHQKVPSQQEMFKGTDFEQKNQIHESIDSTTSGIANINPFTEEKKSEELKEERPSTAITGGVQSFVTTFSRKADSAFDENGMKRPCKLKFVTLPSPLNRS